MNLLICLLFALQGVVAVIVLILTLSCFGTLKRMRSHVSHPLGEARELANQLQLIAKGLIQTTTKLTGLLTRFKSIDFLKSGVGKRVNPKRIVRIAKFALTTLTWINVGRRLRTKRGLAQLVATLAAIRKFSPYIVPAVAGIKLLITKQLQRR